MSQDFFSAVDSDEDQLAWDYSFSNMATRSASADQTVVKNTDLADVIAVNSRNNYGKIVGLKCFCGGRETHADYPNAICERSVVQWVADIEARTADNWTEEGRIQIAKQYALGPAFKCICATIIEGED